MDFNTETKVTEEEVIPTSTTETSSTGTMKLYWAKTHVGPVVDIQSKRKLFTASANKIRLNNDLKVTGVSSEKGDNDSQNKTKSGSSKSQSINLDEAAGCDAAFCYMQAWGNMFKDKLGTPDYVEKANALASARNEIYASFGFEPITIAKKGIRPELTEEQRLAYNEAISKYSFDYYEVRLSFKQKGKKAVRSKTYRYLTVPDLDALRKRLTREVESVRGQYDVIDPKN